MRRKAIGLKLRRAGGRLSIPPQFFKQPVGVRLSLQPGGERRNRGLLLAHTSIMLLRAGLAVRRTRAAISAGVARSSQSLAQALHSVRRMPSRGATAQPARLKTP